MEEDGMDDRFKKVLTDPRFKRLPSRKKKIKIDSRFQGMFDKGFNGEPLIDKRGRKVQNTKNDGLKRFYEIDEKKTEEEDDEEEEEEDKEKPDLSVIARKLRGEDNDEDSSSSDESSSEEEGGEGEEETETVDQVESEVPRTEDITCRFAVTNVDWDRLKAVDLFVMLNSFKPNEGEIVSVKIYPSQFGKERMEKEKLEGPKELTDVKLDEDEEDPYESTTNDADEIINTDIPFVSEKLRRYQINRLKYYYAVVECDRPETAVALYDQLDGMEYESSASTLDLRFIPDDMSFDEDEPDSVCYETPSLIDYNPPHFITTALQQTKVNLTWDETDPNRAKTLQRAFTERDKISDDLACYLASSSSEEDNDDGDSDNFNQVASEEKDSISLEGKSVQDRINRYKDLLKTVEEEEAAEDEKDIDMEIKWEPELENIGKKIVEKKKKESMTIFEKQMAERKAKRKETGKKKKSSNNEIDSEEEEDEEEDGQDDGDQEEKSDENNEDYESEEDNQGDENESDDNNESNEENSDKEDGQGVDEDDLALLVMDNEKKDKKHFNYENFVENKKSKRKKKRKEKTKQEEEDNFEFDEEDPRFKEIYNSHLYNIDQSSSHFKKTQAYDKILKRKASKDPDQRYPVKRSK